MEEPKCYINERGDKFWYLPSIGKHYWHRLDGPAIEWADGSNYWWVDGERHRLDGPAIEWSNGDKWWWVDGKDLSSQEVEAWLEENEVDLKTEEGQMALKLRWA